MPAAGLIWLGTEAKPPPPQWPADSSSSSRTQSSNFQAKYSEVSLTATSACLVTSFFLNYIVRGHSRKKANLRARTPSWRISPLLALSSFGRARHREPDSRKPIQPDVCVEVFIIREKMYFQHTTSDISAPVDTAKKSSSCRLFRIIICLSCSFFSSSKSPI